MVRGEEAVEAADLRPTRLSRAGAIAGMLVVAILLMGAVGLAVALPGLGLRNWLVILFQLNSGIGSVTLDSLRVFNPLDVAALILVGVTFLGLGPTLVRVNRIWMGIAVALPFVGIAILLVTNLAGRSSVMAAGLVIAFLMLKSRAFKSLGYLGILANVLLLVGDFATGGSRAPVVAAVVGAGYVLLVVWFVWIVARLLGRRR